MLVVPVYCPYMDSDAKDSVLKSAFIRGLHNRNVKEQVKFMQTTTFFEAFQAANTVQSIISTRPQDKTNAQNPGNRPPFQNSRNWQNTNDQNQQRFRNSQPGQFANPPPNIRPPPNFGRFPPPFVNGPRPRVQGNVDGPRGAFGAGPRC